MPKLRVGQFDATEVRLICGRLWTRLLERFERDLVYLGVVVSEKPIARAALLTYAGMAVNAIFDSLLDIVKKENTRD